MSQDDETPEKKFSEKVKDKAARVGQHVKDNKAVYLAATGGAVIGGTIVGVVVMRRMGMPMPEIQQTAKNVALIVWKSPPTNIVLTREACPDPIPVRDKLTGEVYRSIRRAAVMTGRNATDISKDVHGAQELFERLPESVFA